MPYSNAGLIAKSRLKARDFIALLGRLFRR